MLTIEQAPSAMASAAARAETIDSSRQTGVRSAGQLGVAAQVVLRQRLLDQQQAEVVEPGEVAGVGEAVGGVGVDLEQHVVAEALADGAHRLDVPAGLDLELDPQVAVGEVAGDGVEQRRRPSGDADATRRPAPGRVTAPR